MQTKLLEERDVAESEILEGIDIDGVSLKLHQLGTKPEQDPGSFWEELFKVADEEFTNYGLCFDQRHAEQLADMVFSKNIFNAYDRLEQSDFIAAVFWSVKLFDKVGTEPREMVLNVVMEGVLENKRQEDITKELEEANARFVEKLKEKNTEGFLPDAGFAAVFALLEESIRNHRKLFMSLCDTAAFMDEIVEQYGVAMSADPPDLRRFISTFIYENKALISFHASEIMRRCGVSPEESERRTALLGGPGYLPEEVIDTLLEAKRGEIEESESERNADAQRDIDAKKLLKLIDFGQLSRDIKIRSKSKPVKTIEQAIIKASVKEYCTRLELQGMSMKKADCAKIVEYLMGEKIIDRKNLSPSLSHAEVAYAEVLLCDNPALDVVNHVRKEVHGAVANGQNDGEMRETMDQYEIERLTLLEEVGDVSEDTIEKVMSGVRKYTEAEIQNLGLLRDTPAYIVELFAKLQCAVEKGPDCFKTLYHQILFEDHEFFEAHRNELIAYLKNGKIFKPLPRNTPLKTPQNLLDALVICVKRSLETSK